MPAEERIQFPVNEAGVVRTFEIAHLPSQHSTFSKITSQMLHPVTAASTGNGLWPPTLKHRVRNLGRPIQWKEFAGAAAGPMGEAVYQETKASTNRTPVLEDNALVLSKQAAKYRQKCPDVALFDWNTTFVHL